MKIISHFFPIFILVTTGFGWSDYETWQQYKRNHNKVYKSLHEERIRFRIFQNNLRKIDKHNQKYYSGNTKFTMGINDFVDKLPSELPPTGHYLRSKRMANRYYYSPSEYLLIPKSKDWRKYGAVTEVRNQKNCGACWAFATLTAVESHLYLTNQTNLTDLSVQNLVDCATKPAGYRISGCDGGELEDAFRYISEHGVIAEKHYPYLGEICKTCFCKPLCYGLNNHCFHIKDYAYIQRLNEIRIMAAVGTIGPVAVGIDANELLLYHGGIIDDEVGCKNNSLNHGVTIVGYDSEQGVDYWIVKNSWGKKWGENGFFRIKRGTNQCGIAWIPSFPIV